MDLLYRAFHQVIEPHPEPLVELLLKPELLQAFGSGASGPDC